MIIGGYLVWSLFAFLGWLIFKEFLWSAYSLMIIYISYKIIEMIVTEGNASISYYELIFIFFMYAAIGSIKCLKGQGCANE